MSEEEYEIVNIKTKNIINTVRGIKSIKPSRPDGCQRIFFKDGGNMKVKKGYLIRKIIIEDG